MSNVSPQPRGAISPADQTRLRAALEAKVNADTEIRAAVLEAVEHGASVRELAAFTGLSTNTVSRWKRD
jgi:DNA-directed RNA polymerase specialized sigma24 family protein